MRHSSLRHPVAKIRVYRFKMNQRAFAKLAGIGESTLAKIESLQVPLTPTTARVMAKNLGMPKDVLASLLDFQLAREKDLERRRRNGEFFDPKDVWDGTVFEGDASL